MSSPFLTKRVQRFSKGDAVRVCFGGVATLEGTVEKVVLHALHGPYAHMTGGCGVSALYILRLNSGYLYEAYDWQLQLVKRPKKGFWVRLWERISR